MIRYITAVVASAAIATAAWAQQTAPDAYPGEQEVREFMEELVQYLPGDAETYMDRLSFPVQISVVTEEGELLTGTFHENEFKLLGYGPADQIRVHAAQQAGMREMRAAMGERAAAEELDEEETVIEEELALMPRERISEEAVLHVRDTEVQFVNENIAFARTTLHIGDEPIVVGEAGEHAEGEAMEEAEEEVVEEERAVRPGPEQATLEVGALLVREEGEWRVKSIVSGDARLYESR